MRFYYISLQFMPIPLVIECRHAFSSPIFLSTYKHSTNVFDDIYTII